MAETFGLTGVNIEEKQQVQPTDKKTVKIDEKTSTMPPISIKTDQKNSERKEPISSLSKKNNPSGTFLPKKLNTKDQPRSIIRSASSSLHAMEFADKKFGTLKSVLDDLRVTRDLKMDKDKLIIQYNQKILEKYESIYEKSNREVIVKELLNLEKKKYLQNDLDYRENMAQLGKQKFNSLKYETEKKMIHLKNLNKQIDDIQSLFPTTQIIEKFQAKEEELHSLGEKLQQMHFEEQSLEHMQWARRKMLLDVKKQCTILNDEMQYVNQHKQVQWSHSHIRKNYMKDLLSKFPFLNDAKKQKGYKPNKDKLGEKFNENLDDELSEFEETRAIKTILQHEEILEAERMKELEEERKILEKKKKQERDKLFERANREQRKEQEILNKLKNSFREIKLVTNISDINELKEYQGKYENEKESMEQIKQYLSDKMKEEKKEIEKIKQEIKSLKFENDEEFDKQIEFNYDRLEQNLIQKNNETFENEMHLKKLERTIDGVGMIISRILYQLNGKKSRNIEVKRDELLNCVSVAGLKLERMLTILFKKKSNFRIESINTDGSVQQAPQYLGLSGLKVYENESEKENQFERLFNDPDALLIKNYKDNEVIDEDKYLEQAREKLKQRYDQKQPVYKEKEIEPQKQQDKALFKGLKGINL